MKKLSAVLVLLGLMLIIGPLAQPLLADGPVHWSYEGEEGPDHWGDLSHDFELCKMGQQQSPVDIPADAATNPGDIAFNYQPSALTLLNNGHTIQANYDAGSTMTVAGKTYNLAQFHFHIPSEHELDGNLTAMELHLVHKADDGELAVVGIMLVPGAENAALASVFNNLPAQVQDATPVAGATVNATDFLPADHTFYRYDGSLTTPPCTQGVKWQVMQNTVEVSQAQIDAFKAIFENDARPVQPLNGRAFLLVSTLPNTGGTFEANLVLVSAGLVLVLSGFVVYRRSTRA